MKEEGNRFKHSKKENYIKLSHSERTPLHEAESLGLLNPDNTIEATILIRRPSLGEALGRVTTTSLDKNRHMSREEFENVFSAAEEDIGKIKAFAAQNDLLIEEINEAAGTVRLSGNVTSFNQAFGIHLEQYKHPHYKFRSHNGPIFIPEELADVVEAVLGLDNRPQLKPHFQMLEEALVDRRARRATSASFTPAEVAKLYNFPTTTNRSVTPCIGIIELGGGYSLDDLKTYFASLGIQEPTVTSVSVNGASNQPTGDPNSADGEVMLDIEVAGAVAPGANIFVYFAPNTDAGFLNAIKTAIHDKQNKPSVLSISWGSAETNWTKQAMNAMDRAFQDAATLGITVCCAAGDQGSSDGVQDGKVHVDFPSSSPYVLACGGTQLNGSNDVITSETVWHESSTSSTGGGVSEVFGLPTWQQSANVPPSANPSGYIGRGVPDVAGDADPKTGYQVLVGGNTYVFGGTSAVAPLWAGLVALINQEIGHTIGFINPLLYNAKTQQALHDITVGDNDTSSVPAAYPAKTGWDACTGLGTPDGTKLLAVFQQQTGSN
jgi:kumamolisin